MLATPTREFLSGFDRGGMSLHINVYTNKYYTPAVCVVFRDVGRLRIGADQFFLHNLSNQIQKYMKPCGAYGKNCVGSVERGYNWTLFTFLCVSKRCFITVFICRFCRLQKSTWNDFDQNLAKNTSGV